MMWYKQGKIFTPNNHFDWLVTHAQVPTVLVMKDRFRVFFATRTTSGKSQIGLIDLELDNPKKIIRLHEHPVLKLGKPGTFDEDGVMPSCLLQKGNELWLYYTGWNQKVTTPYHNGIGLAVSNDGGFTFTRLYDGPIIDRNLQEPYLAVTPCVLAEQNIYKMWYASGVDWVKIDEKYEPIYVIKYATSKNGITWERTGQTSIVQQHAQEALCAPTVITDQGHFKMWYSYRDSTHFRDGNGSYRIGYAESDNGLTWNRMDNKAGISLSPEKWDSTMLCYPNIVKHHHQLYMFYNGNSFGRNGFGYAVMPASN